MENLLTMCIKYKQLQIDKIIFLIGFRNFDTINQKNET